MAGVSGAGPLRVPMLTAVSADESTSQPVKVSSYAAPAVIVSGVGTTSSGVITIEEADFDPATEMIYSGTWSLIVAVNASDVTGGAQKIVHLSPGAYAYVRTRVSTVIGGGGTISTVLRAS